jgi:tetratricopeptide (TPR) repeat protein
MHIIVSHVTSAGCQLCRLLQIPNVFSSGTLAHLHSAAHVAILKRYLAEALGHRYNHSYIFADIREKINLCRDALVFLNEHSSHISPVPTIASLGAALCVRFNVSAQRNDLQEGFELLSSAVHACPSESHYATDLGQLLIHRYMVSGSVDSLDKSLALLRHAYGLRIGHPARGRICQTIAAATILKDQHIGRRSEFSLDDLIEYYKEMLLCQPLGHHSHFEAWDGLGMVFRMQSNRISGIHLLDRAIRYGQIAYIMLNPQHPRAFRFSANLSNAFENRYQALGNPADLEFALFHARRALDIAPGNRRPKLLRDLAHVRTFAASYSGDVEILSEGISVAREALECVNESLKFLALETLCS